MPANYPTPEQLHRFTHLLSVFVSDLPRIALLIGLVVCGVLALYGLIILALRLLAIRWLLGRRMAFLELTPLAFADKPPQAHEKFFSDLHGYEATLKIGDKLLARRFAFSVELVGTRDLGIRYIFCVPYEQRDSFKKDIASFGSEIRIQEVADYVTPEQRVRARLLEFKLKRRYYPLAAHDKYEQGDPIAYLLGTMAQLQSGELMALQLVLSPTNARRAQRMHNRMLHNQERMDTLGQKGSVTAGSKLVRGINSALYAAVDTAGEAFHGPSLYSQQAQRSTREHYRQASMGIKPHRSLGSLEEMLARQVGEKFDQQKFRANIRALIVADGPRGSAAKANDLRKAFNVYRTSRQAIQSRLNVPYGLRGKYRHFMFEHRLPGVFDRTSCLLSVSEAASVYHFPNSMVVRNGDVAVALSRTLAAPLAVRNSADNHGFAVLLGRNHHLGSTLDIGLTSEERERHVFIVGGTGSGKTTMLKYALVQDMRSGNGLAVIDPHGDMAQELLGYVPEDRIEDVVYFNPDDLAYPIGLNVLELTPGLTGDELLREKDLVTESVVSMFRKIFSEDGSGGHRIEYVLRNAIQTALTIDGATLFTVYNLLNDPDYCQTVVRALTNVDLLNFWQNELGKAGEFQQVKMVSGITAKIGRFLFSASAKRVLEQPKSTINFDDVLDSGKILICNFSKALGEDTSTLFGISVLAKIQIASFRRARVKQADRRPFYLYVDEFQNFATQSFVQMLSESRKYKLFLTMAEQSTSQQDDQKMVHVMLANVGTVICFRTGSPADERLLLPLFSPYITAGGIANLSPYNFYARMAAVRTQEPLSGMTLQLDDSCSEVVAESVIRSSRARYAKRYVPPEPAQPQKPASGEAGAAAQGDIMLPSTKGRLRRTRKKTVYQLAAQWMMSEIEYAGRLQQEVAALHIGKAFGKDCVELTASGNLSISDKVRDAFKKLHRGTVGWEKEGQAWYKLEG